MRLRGLAVLIILALCGCASQKPREDALPPIDMAELQPFIQSGTASVEGEFFLRTAGGDIKSGAGKVVFLYPGITHTSVFFNTPPQMRSYDTAFKRVVMNLDKKINEYRKSSVCNMNGRFSFNNLPAGQYFLIGDLYWHTGNSITGATVVKLIELTPGQNLELLLTE